MKTKAQKDTEETNNKGCLNVGKGGGSRWKLDDLRDYILFIFEPLDVPPIVFKQINKSVTI